MNMQTKVRGMVTRLEVAAKRSEETVKRIHSKRTVKKRRGSRVVEGVDVVWGWGVLVWCWFLVVSFRVWVI